MTLDELRNVSFAEVEAAAKQAGWKPVTHKGENGWQGPCPSVDRSNPAIYGHRKTGHFRRPETGVEFYFTASSERKAVWTLVRQLRGPHLSTWA